MQFEHKIYIKKLIPPKNIKTNIWTFEVCCFLNFRERKTKTLKTIFSTPVSIFLSFTLLFFSTNEYSDGKLTCRATGLICRSAIGWKRFSLRKSYKFWPSISNTRQAWPWCRKHSNAQTTLKAPAFSWRSLSKIDTSIWPWRVYEGWFFSTLIATTSLLPCRQHFTTWPNVPLPRNSNTYNATAYYTYYIIILIIIIITG